MVFCFSPLHANIVEASLGFDAHGAGGEEDRNEI